MTPRVNPLVRTLVCSKSGEAIDASRAFERPVALSAWGASPGAPVEVRYDDERLRPAMRLAIRPTRDRERPGLLRFAEALPVAGLDAAYCGDVGDTPQLEAPALARALGVDVALEVKNESGNPTGSFKDRGLAVAVALAAACGARRLCLPTQGNAGVAAACFSRRAGLEPAVVYMPEGYESSIYARAAAHFGADVRYFGANIAATGREMRERLAEPLAAGELVDVSTFFEPGRLEGKKTMGLEIATSGGAAPLDAIIYPTGGGTGLVGIHRAYAQLAELGLAGDARPPRLYAVQSEQCAPVVVSFEAGLDHVEPVTSRGTRADGLDVPGAIMGHGIMRALRESAGGAVAVSEQQIEQAFAALGDAGVGAGYESAATAAALALLVQRGDIEPGARVLLLLTGSQLIAL